MKLWLSVVVAVVVASSSVMAADGDHDKTKSPEKSVAAPALPAKDLQRLSAAVDACTVERGAEASKSSVVDALVRR